jgi:hypothetical protein
LVPLLLLLLFLGWLRLRWMSAFCNVPALLQKRTVYQYSTVVSTRRFI